MTPNVSHARTWSPVCCHRDGGASKKYSLEEDDEVFTGAALEGINVAVPGCWLVPMRVNS